MRTRLLELTMHGWISEFDKNLLPPKQGVYFVFGGKKNNKRNAEGKETANITHLIYIGQSEDIRRRLETHEKQERFDEELESGETLFYYYIKVNESAVDDCEGALIRHFKDMPIINEKCKEAFTSEYENVHIVLSGSIPFLLSNDIDFMVKTNSSQ